MQISDSLILIPCVLETKWRTNKAKIHAEELAKINVHLFTRFISVRFIGNFTHLKKQSRL